MMSCNNNKLRIIVGYKMNRSIKNKANIFTEIGFDKDNNKYILGISSEIENEDKTEYRVPGFMPLSFEGMYCRFWIFKTVFAVGYPGGFNIRRKKRNNLKLILGISGSKKEGISYNKYKINEQ